MSNQTPGGLTAEQVIALQSRYGKNELTPRKKDNFLLKVLHIMAEPMFLLLMIAAVIYFILGEMRDGAIMLIFVAGIISIDVIQEWKTDKTLNALKDLSAPHITVLRDGAEITVASADLVPGDWMMISEGAKIPADGVILRCSDLRVDESSLTGEAEGVWKTPTEPTEQAETSASDDYWRRDYCYAGTLVTQGTALVEVEYIGTQTEYGKIGRDVAEAKEEKSPLQTQTGSLVKLCAGIAAVLFALVGVATWFNIPDHVFGARLIESILSGTTLAMAMIPEEFPVILTVFLSMGAWRLAKKNSLVRRLPAVETLGAVTVLCVDKTGTITQNRMSVQECRPVVGGERVLYEVMGLACEPETYDPMETAMLTHCEAMGIPKAHLFGGELLNEYAFTNELKMMGHVWRHDGELLIAAKGSPENILELCGLNEALLQDCEAQTLGMSEQGLRVIAVALCRLNAEDEIPANLTDCKLTLCGFVGLADPPREGVREDIALCAKAGIRVVMITGDNGVTAAAIARQIGMYGTGRILTGDMLEEMGDEELREQVKTASIFSRVIPAHKMRIVKALKENGEVVAMTGDGVNDAPALKNADIGIAMGKRGSEVSREAADMILMDDDFTTIVDTVRDGRRIYDNIRKAVGYVFTIHIPIALASLLAPMLGIDPVGLMLLPLHVVLLELIIDPTCSVVLERQPAERDVMERRPRNPKARLIGTGGLLKSVLQGLMVFAASFGAYYLTLAPDFSNAPAARAMGLAVIMLANLFLVHTNSSDTDSILVSLRYLSKDRVMWAVSLFTLAGLAAVLYTPLSKALALAPLSAAQLGTTVLLAGASVLWIEAVKWVKRRRKAMKNQTR
ncbi:MAG: cation-translocating P-type ATPase [Oscillospiraceae bacterium]|nr:cation-translocating P-type ATPase [Oscillospiraceae bacterium]